jgi:hypothetical protein
MSEKDFIKQMKKEWDKILEECVNPNTHTTLFSVKDQLKWINGHMKVLETAIRQLSSLRKHLEKVQLLQLIREDGEEDKEE